MKDTLIYLATGSGRIEVEAPLQYISQVTTTGSNDIAVEDLYNLPTVQEQLKQIPLEVIREEYREYSADNEELIREDMEKFLLWNMCWDYSDRNEED